MLFCLRKIEVYFSKFFYARSNRLFRQSRRGICDAVVFVQMALKNSVDFAWRRCYTETEQAVLAAIQEGALWKRLYFLILYCPSV